MSKLSSDNKDLMPITDAVYGQGRHKGPEKESAPRGHTELVYRRIPFTTFRALVRRGTANTRKLRRDS